MFPSFPNPQIYVQKRDDMEDIVHASEYRLMYIEPAIPILNKQTKRKSG